MRRAYSCIAMLVLFTTTPRAQVRASELGSVSQTIDGTTITIRYSRPRARGRSPLFGGPVVKWNEVWTPGANWATTFTVDKDVTLDGHRVAKGTYSVWMVVRKSGEWTMVLDPKAKLYHMTPPDSNLAQIRFAVRTQEAPFADVLTWSFPALRMDGGTIAMQWGTTLVAMQLGVEPSLVNTMSPADAAPYVGRYDYSEFDSAGKATDRKVLTVLYEGGTLKGEFEPKDPYFLRFALVRIAPDWFVPGIYDEHGDIYEVLRPDMVVEFGRSGDQVTTLTWRDDQDVVFAKGTRRP